MTAGMPSAPPPSQRPSPNQSPKLKDYQIHLPPLGQGSYGVVYRATYRGISDRAVKVFKPDKVDLSTVARELEKLSSVAEHPGIVTLHDFDLAADTPYYAMGLHAIETTHHTWKGRTLDDICGRVDGREALRLLTEIANALAYLHRHQIIHCDIKPSNVLLTDETPPRIKICDFGQSRGTGVETFEPAGTPYYAPPEQLRAPHDSAGGKGFKWDVYSFGALAYKLLTGRLPRLQDLSEVVYDDIDPDATIVDTSSEQSIIERSSTLSSCGRLRAPQLADLIEGEPEIIWSGRISRSRAIDLELKNVVARCLSLDPAKRYADMRETVSAIEDIQRRKSVKRAHRLIGTFAALSFLALGATAFAFKQMQESRAASAREKSARDAAEALVHFILFDLGQRLNPMAQGEILEHIVNNAEDYVSSLANDLRTARTLQTKAVIENQRGDTAYSQGDYEKAMDHYGTAYTIAAGLLKENPELKDLRLHLAKSLVAMGNVHRAKGYNDEALIDYQNALKVVRDHFSDNPEGPGIRAWLAVCLTEVAEMQQLTRDMDAALESYQEALAVMRESMERWEKEEKAGNKSRPGLARSAGPGGKGTGQRPIMDFGGRPGDRDLSSLPSIPKVLEAIGDIHADQKGYVEAANSYQEALAFYQKESRLGQDYQERVADTLTKLGRVYVALGNRIDAQIQFMNSLTIRERLSESEPSNLDRRLDVAENYADLGESQDLQEAGANLTALARLRRALDVLEETKDTPEIAQRKEALTLRVESSIAGVIGSQLGEL